MTVSTITAADLLLAPVPTVHTLAPEASEAKPAKVPASIALMPTQTDLDALHAAATAAGETRAVFGMTADRTAAVSVLLTPCHRVAGNGRLGAAELSAVSAFAGDKSAARLRAADGRAVFAGRVIGAPTAGDTFATRAGCVILVGSGFESPTRVALTESGPRAFRTSETSAVVLLSGDGTATFFAFACHVRVTRDGGWSVGARIYSGGRLADTDLDTVAIATVGATIDHPNARRK